LFGRQILPYSHTVRLTLLAYLVSAARTLISSSCASVKVKC